LRRPSRSLSAPENSFTIEAVASPMPSTMPTQSAPAPSTVTMNTGSSAWTISEDMSMSIETSPSAQIVRGRGFRSTDAIAMPRALEAPRAETILAPAALACRLPWPVESR